MSTQEPDRAPQAPALTSLPRLEDIPQLPGGGLDPERVKDAFDGFRRHALQLQAQLRVLQAAGRTANVEPTGHAVRVEAVPCMGKILVPRKGRQGRNTRPSGTLGRHGLSVSSLLSLLLPRGVSPRERARRCQV